MTLDHIELQFVVVVVVVFLNPLKAGIIIVSQ